MLLWLVQDINPDQIFVTSHATSVFITYDRRLSVFKILTNDPTQVAIDANASLPEEQQGKEALRAERQVCSYWARGRLRR